MVQISHGANVRDVTVYGCTDILLVSGSFLGEDLNVSMCVVTTVNVSIVLVGTAVDLCCAFAADTHPPSKKTIPG